MASLPFWTMNAFFPKYAIISYRVTSLTSCSSQATDLSLTAKLKESMTKQGMSSFKPCKSAMELGFFINHYAGPVKYDTNGFLEKNRDTLAPGITNMLQSSRIKLVKVLFREEMPANNANDTMKRSASAHEPKHPEYQATLNKRSQTMTRRVRTVCSHFKENLAKLIVKMNMSNPHFVRCIKPNSERVPEEIDEVYVTKQLRYSGVLGVVEIRKFGYLLGSNSPR
eukprot:m.289180 g.289180  ORF g.289180 m.289180 type:complete len:225 (-) comp16371_c1_seq56:4718-5392(-)